MATNYFLTNSTTVLPCVHEEGSQGLVIPRHLGSEARMTGQSENLGEQEIRLLATRTLNPETNTSVDSTISDEVSSEGDHTNEATTTEQTEESTEKTNKDHDPKKSKVSGLKFASMNIRGKNYSDKSSKLKDIATMMLKHRIAVMAIQETRMDQEAAEAAQREHPNLIIINSGRSTAKEGVAFLLNKRAFKEQFDYEVINMQVGKTMALILRLGKPDSNEERLTYFVMNVHMPNEHQDKIDLLNKMIGRTRQYKTFTNKIIMGDWNIVEDAIDRSPQHKDRPMIVDGLQAFLQGMEVHDGWRCTNPTHVDFTFSQNFNNNDETTVSRARIDRIYTSFDVLELTTRWSIDHGLKIADHALVSVEVIKPNQPFIGNGFKRMRTQYLEHPDVKTITKEDAKKLWTNIESYEMKELLSSTKEEISNIREEHNPQELWFMFLSSMMRMNNSIHKDKMKNSRFRLEQNKKRRIKLLRELKKRDLTTEESEELSKVEKESKEIEFSRILESQRKARANYDEYCDSSNKYWFGLKKDHKSSEVLPALRDTEGNLCRETKRMEKVAREYHGKLQAKPEWTPEREAATKQLVDRLQRKLTPDKSAEMDEPITAAEIRLAIKAAKNNKSPGLDGIPYEFYKKFPTFKVGDETIRVENILSKVFKDIRKHGVWNMPSNENNQYPFTSGVMSLLYKKKDKMEIENYRPITLLGTDYKLMTKCIATRLGEVAGDIIHPNQTGFVPKRSLYDSVRMSELMIDYAERTKQNGCIIALDQEKAYDKIDHNYLWKVLEAFGFGEDFINMIKTLYSNGYTNIMVNGVMATPIAIERGVRQGDPMSCILYDLAIEPLAEAIRQSSLEGYRVKGLIDKILVSLFADDTIVYVNERDNIHTLYEIINEFCCASTARFNIPKTEFLPIGTKEYRDKVIQTRTIGAYKVPEGIRIVKDKESMRTLGAWIGNDVNQYPQWEAIMSKQANIMKMWQSTHPSFKGKELILKALVQSRALFLATVNGMPQDVRKKMNRNMRNFLWEGKKGTMSWDEVIAPREIGGLNIPDIEIRYQAITIMWLKKWLSSKERPGWAYVADEIIATAVQQKPLVDNESTIQWALQNWNEVNSVNKDVLPKCLTEMLSTARKVNLGIETRAANAETKRELPVWHHIAVDSNHIWNKKAARCLRKNHNILSVGELQDEIEVDKKILRNKGCESPGRCIEIGKTIIEHIGEKFNPLHNPNVNYEEPGNAPAPNGRKWTFNKSIEDKGHPFDLIRILGELPNYKKERKPTRVTTDVVPKPSQTVDGLVEIQYAVKHVNDQVTITISKIEDDIPSINSIQTEARMGESIESTELYALARAIKEADNKNLYIHVPEYIFKFLQKVNEREDEAWIGVQNRNEWQLLLFALRSKGGPTTLIIESKQLRLKAPEPVIIEQRWKPDLRNWALHGATLMHMTQAKAYALLLERKTKYPGSDGIKTSHRVLAAIEQTKLYGNEATEEQLWMSFKKRKKYSPKIGDFLWKIMHDRHKCGPYFRNLPEMQDLQWCRVCSKSETIEHILFECIIGKTLWSEAETIWNRALSVKWITDANWVQPTITSLTVNSFQKLKTSQADKKNRVGETLTRWWHILIPNTAWIIWKLRCKEAIDKIKFTEDQLKAGLHKQLESVVRNKTMLLIHEAKQSMSVKDLEKTVRELQAQWDGVVEVKIDSTKQKLTINRAC
jgi:exonuclease III